METFGTRLARLRKERGLTQDSVADRLHISAQAVSKWENDLTSPDIDTLIKLSEMLNVSLDELMGRVKKDAVELCDPIKTDIDKMALRIYVDSVDGDKVRINLPVPLVRILMANEGGVKAMFKGNKWAEGIDFAGIFALIESGVIGELITVDSAQGDHVRIVVE